MKNQKSKDKNERKTKLVSGIQIAFSSSFWQSSRPFFVSRSRKRAGIKERSEHDDGAGPTGEEESRGRGIERWRRRGSRRRRNQCFDGDGGGGGEWFGTSCCQRRCCRLESHHPARLRDRGDARYVYEPFSNKIQERKRAREREREKFSRRC